MFHFPTTGSIIKYDYLKYIFLKDLISKSSFTSAYCYSNLKRANKLINRQKVRQTHIQVMVKKIKEKRAIKKYIDNTSKQRGHIPHEYAKVMKAQKDYDLAC